MLRERISSQRTCNAECSWPVCWKYALGPVTPSYPLTQDFDGRSPWWQGCTVFQGIIEPNHAATCKQVCTTCTLLTLAANEVSPWSLFGDLGEILEREAACKLLHSTHVVVGPFDMLVRMRADRCSKQLCWWRMNVSVLRPSQSPGTIQLPDLIVIAWVTYSCDVLHMFEFIIKCHTEALSSLNRVYNHGVDIYRCR